MSDHKWFNHVIIGRIISLLCLISLPLPATELKNDRLRLELGFDRQGFPCLDRAEWRSDHQALFTHQDVVPEKTVPWLPPELAAIPGKTDTTLWRVTDDSLFIHAICERRTQNLAVRWHVLLMRHQDLIRLFVEIRAMNRAVAVPWYPIWTLSWKTSGAQTALTSWQALSYQQREQNLSTGDSVVLGSKRYSSDGEEEDGDGAGMSGQLPFWQLYDGHNRTSFSLAWCGGWQAEITGHTSRFALRSWLPTSETQLVLNAGEAIQGPAMTVYFQRANNEMLDRSAWFEQRFALARALYPQPPAGFPLIYNHWYSVGFKLAGDFITSQARFVKELGFDVFVVDAGWYESVGNWTPSQSKFKTGEFESALRFVRDLGIPVGLWSCPWLLAVQGNDLPAEVDRPGLFREFMHAYALDLAGIDFTRQLVDHVHHLYHDYGMRWWKYDQEFLGDQTRHGAMKNMLALQNALTAVRKAFPDLVIENCMSGGRMINEFTDDISSIHWIRDGGRNGLNHLRSNVTEALGAAQLLPLYKVQRWTNRIDEISDDELLRAYCRSAMVGVWGISADLRKLSGAQKQLVRTMARQYRDLNLYKRDNHFEICSRKDQDVTAIAFYDATANAAAVLAYRLTETTGTTGRLQLHGLPPAAVYRIRDVDLNKEVILNGPEVLKNGWQPEWTPQRRSGLFFIHAEDR